MPPPGGTFLCPGRVHNPRWMDSSLPPGQADLLVLGAGIVGASVAYHAAPHARVVVLEREPQPGMHSTGRSAALFLEGYGPQQVRALTRASRAFLHGPPGGFSSVPLVGARGALTVAAAGQQDALAAKFETLRTEIPLLRTLDRGGLLAHVPVFRPEAAVAAFHDPGAADLDVDALLQGFLRGARARGAQLVCGLGDVALSRHGGAWRAEAGRRRWEAPAVVNASGAWADVVASQAGVAPIGLEPRRRSAFTFEPPVGLSVERWPAVTALDESYYFKPDACLLLGSPANADPVSPHDVMPEDLDVALGIDRIERATTMRIARPRSAWAGLRCFSPDGEPVIGPDRAAPGFHWAAALGGYGIQTSPAVGALSAAQALGLPVPDWLTSRGVDPERLRPR